MRSVEKTSQGTKYHFQAIVSYRSFQLLVKIFNKAMCGILFMFLLSCGTCQVVAALVLLNKSEQISFLIKTLFSIAVIESFLVFVVDFYEQSETTLADLKRNFNDNLGIRRKERKHLGLFLRSCQVASIRLGFSNYIEKLTPPLVQMYCVDRLVDLLLLQN